MSTARQIMTAKPHSLQTGMDILDAVEFFNKHGISSAPVLNPLGEALGQMTELTLIKALAKFKAGTDFTQVIDAEEMLEPVVFVRDFDDIPTVMKALMGAPSHRVLVKDVGEQIVGIIAPKDILRVLQSDQEIGKEVNDEIRTLQLELEKMRGQMQEMSRYLQTYDMVFQSGLFGLHSADREGRIIVANEKLHNFLGYPLGELVGKSIFDLYPKEMHELAKGGLQTVMESGRHNLTQTLMCHCNGEKVSVDLASAAMRDEKGRFIGTFTISRVHGTEKTTGEFPEIFGRKE